MSFLSRLSVDMSNAVSDAYGNIMYGDDAGKSAKLVFVAKPRASLTPIPAKYNTEELNLIPVTNFFDLGVTFLEVNGRAYVRNVAPDSSAEAAGVQPRDCVQFGVVLCGELSSLREDEGKSASYALECEKRGFRTSFVELKTMFAGCCITEIEDKVDRELWRSRIQQQQQPLTQKGAAICSPKVEDTTNLSNVNAGGKYPVVIVFRRTRKRHHATLGGLVPIGVPSFRIDDECDRAATLVRRLAPTADTTPDPDAWDEIVHDGTEWLLPDGSIMPPHQTPSPIGAWISHTRPNTAQLTEDISADATATDLSSLVSKTNNHGSAEIKRVKSGDLTQTGEDTIPPDSWEATSNAKKNQVRSQMLAEAIHQGNLRKQDDMEAAFIRGMIQKAVGLAFVRTSKVVMGVSVHVGSGIIIARLPDGTWSAPSAIGIFGAGFGFQFGLEVVEYIFILRTEESLQQFRVGGHVTLGGNLGAAFAGMGREALGAASFGGTMCAPKTHPNGYPMDVDDFDFEVKPIQISPIIAYARTQGLYVGLSLEGSRIFTRHDINNRTYKFAIGKAVTPADILGGKIPTPPEAEDLYASLHSAEFTHELSGIPRPPEILRKDSPNDWRYDRSTLTSTEGGNFAPPFSFLSTITDADAEECSAFETTFKKFLYGGVSVQRLVPNAQSSGGKTRRERRTLWLMLPEVGALRLGFISKLHDGESGSNAQAKKSGGSRASSISRLSSPRGKLKMRRGRSNVSDSDDSFTEYSEVTEDYTVTSCEDSRTFDEAEPDAINSTARTEDESATVRSSRSRNVHLSNKHSVALTDVTLLSQEPNVSIRFSPEDATEHLKFIAVHDCRGTSLLFLANNFREAELLVCGLKLLIERETARLEVRGGIPINQLGRKPEYSANGGYLSNDVASHRSRDGSASSAHDSLRFKSVRIRRDPSPCTSSDNEENFDEKIPEGRKSWSQVPGRNYLRDQASMSQSGEDIEEMQRSVKNDEAESNTKSPEQAPNYYYGQMIIREIAVNIKLPLPLPLCRVLLLDSSSPVISKWENDRGDSNYSKSRWTFPPETARDLERHASEHKLIASGSMMGAHRATSYQRMRNGSLVQLTETQIVDADDPEKVAFSIAERLPRRGFSVKVRILLRSTNTHNCEATVLAEVRPIGKNMSNQIAVHRALLLVLEEIKLRYGAEGKGLLAGFLNVVNNLPDNSKPPTPSNGSKIQASSQEQLVISRPNIQFVENPMNNLHSHIQGESTHTSAAAAAANIGMTVENQQSDRSLMISQKGSQYPSQKSQFISSTQQQSTTRPTENIHQNSPTQASSQIQQILQKSANAQISPHQSNSDQFSQSSSSQVKFFPTTQGKIVSSQSRISSSARHQKPHQIPSLHQSNRPNHSPSSNLSCSKSKTISSSKQSSQGTIIQQYTNNAITSQQRQQKQKIISSIPSPLSKLSSTSQNSVQNETKPSISLSSPSSQSFITGNTSRAAVLANRRRARYKDTSNKKPINSESDNRRSRPVTPSEEGKPPTKSKYNSNQFADFPKTNSNSEEPMTIEVKPLPKIRLDLMPAPREEDEEEDSSAASPSPASRRSRSQRLTTVRNKK